jgi:hypothetical protein
MATPRPAHGDSRYVEAVVDAYSSMPGTTGRASRQDRRLARSLEEQAVPLDIVLAAIVIGTARRTLRSASKPALPPVRTLAYFMGVVEELLVDPPDTDYVAYLRAKLSALQPPPPEIRFPRPNSGGSS